MEAEPSTRRSRLWPWLAVAVAFLGIVGYLLDESVWGRGANYYAPRWRIPGLLPNSELVERSELLSSLSVEQALPVLIAGAARRPSPMGEKWEEWRRKWSEHLPEKILPMIPKYEDREDFHGRLGVASSDRRVAEAVARHWPRWATGDRVNFLTALAYDKRSWDPVLIPVLVSAMQESEPQYLRCFAELVVAGLTNRPEVLDESLSRNLVHESDVLERLVRVGGVSERLELAIAQGLESTEFRHRFFSAMALVRLFPDRYPADRILGPRLDRRMFAEGWNHMKYLAGEVSVFRAVTGSTVFQRRCLELLGAPNASSPEDLVPRRILGLLARVGTPDATAALALRPWLSETNHGVFTEAMGAYLASAPPNAAHAEWVASGLTNRAVCAPVLLWLTEAGTNGIQLAPMVEALASDALVIGGKTDPSQLRAILEEERMGGIILNYHGSRFPAPRIEMRASEMQAHPSSTYPKRLMAFWPKSARMTNSPSAAKPEPVSLIILAERCLRRLRGQLVD